MSEMGDRVTRLCTKHSHHRNLSVMYIVQNPVRKKNKEQGTISLNSHYTVLFKNPRDAVQILTGQANVSRSYLLCSRKL